MNSEDSDCCTEDQLYEVEEIVDKKISKGRIKYYVKWVGYDNAQNTWEPKDHLPLEMVEEFEEKLRNNRKEKISKSSTNSLLNKKREKQKEEKTVNKKENKSEDNKQFLTEENHPNFSESVNKNTLKSKIKSLRVNAPLPEKYNSLTHESDTLEGKIYIIKVVLKEIRLRRLLILKFIKEKNYHVKLNGKIDLTTLNLKIVFICMM